MHIMERSRMNMNKLTFYESIILLIEFAKKSCPFFISSFPNLADQNCKDRVDNNKGNTTKENV